MLFLGQIVYYSLKYHSIPDILEPKKLILKMLIFVSLVKYDIFLR